MGVPIKMELRKSTMDMMAYSHYKMQKQMDQIKNFFRIILSILLQYVMFYIIALLGYTLFGSDSENSIIYTDFFYVLTCFISILFSVLILLLLKVKKFIIIISCIAIIIFYFTW